MIWFWWRFNDLCKSKISLHCDDWYLFKVRLSRKVAAFDIAYTVFACRVACDRGISWRKIQIRGLRYATWSILDFDEFCFPKMVILMSHKLFCLCAYRVIVGYQSGQTLAARHLQQLPCTTTSKQVMASLTYEQGLRGYLMFSTTGCDGWDCCEPDKVVLDPLCGIHASADDSNER